MSYNPQSIKEATAKTPTQIGVETMMVYKILHFKLSNNLPIKGYDTSK